MKNKYLGWGKIIRNAVEKKDIPTPILVIIPTEKIKSNLLKICPKKNVGNT